MNITSYGAMLKLDWYQKKRPVLERMLAKAKESGAGDQEHNNER
jgi:hypothetical protein